MSEVATPIATSESAPTEPVKETSPPSIAIKGLPASLSVPLPEPSTPTTPSPASQPIIVKKPRIIKPQPPSEMPPLQKAPQPQIVSKEAGKISISVPKENTNKLTLQIPKDRISKSPSKANKEVAAVVIKQVPITPMETTTTPQKITKLRIRVQDESVLTRDIPKL